MSILDGVISEAYSKLPSLKELEELSFKISIDRSTNKLDVNDSVVRIVQSDAQTYKTVLESSGYIDKYLCRVKTPDSIKRKLERHQDAKFQSVFNDILGIRIRVNSYDIMIPDYYRIVDMRKGKSHDDGYRAIHLYFKLDNFHYIIEVQLWSEEDYNFNQWTHTYGYKSIQSDILLKLRKMYDNGLINSYKEYLEEMNRLCQR